MKQDLFTAPGLYLLRQMDRWNGASYIAWKPHVSAVFTDRRELLRFIAWPAKTPTGDALRAWLDAFEDEPAAAAEDAPAGLPQEVVLTGFGPECHLDQTDPNHNTKTII